MSGEIAYQEPELDWQVDICLGVACASSQAMLLFHSRFVVASLIGVFRVMPARLHFVMTQTLGSILAAKAVRDSGMIVGVYKMSKYV